VISGGRPLPATAAALGGMLLIAIAAHAAAWYEHVWFAWVVLLLQLALGLFCSVVYNSLRLYIEKRLLEQSLAAHLSPAVVKRVLKDPSLRRQGGVKQEVSLLFSDIASFSRVSEILHPDDLLDLLNRYFEAALKCIHETDGTVMDLVGDAIFAVWNAPIEQPDHRERACRAAMMLRDQLVEFNASQRTFPLRTRVGLHTGIVCIGNIGSAQRFDYAAVGESTNLASRLEGLN
jgi:adenylate cyclase